MSVTSDNLELPMPSSNLALDLALDREAYPAGSPILATLTLRCVKAADLVVNTRMVLNSPLAPPVFREVYYNIKGPAGEPVKFGARVNVGYADPDDFKALGPGDLVERQYPLHRFYNLTRPGRYSVQATYHNLSDPEDGRPAWKKVIMSPTVSFVVVGAAEGEL